MASEKFMFAVRNKKGQIGYLSDGLELPEFVDLFKPKGESSVLVDYSPIIEKLHALHKSASNEDILSKSNALFNFWQDSKSYTKESVKAIRNQELTNQANLLINELQLRLQKGESEVGVRWRSSLHERFQLIDAIRKDSDIYIDALLCFAHSKASLDIASFKTDVVLTAYGEFLYRLVSRLYRRCLGEGTFHNSYLKFIALQHPAKLEYYLQLEGKDESPDQFVVQMLRLEKPYHDQNDQGVQFLEISIRCDPFHHDYVRMVETLGDLLYKISSVNRFLKMLKEGGHEWDESADSVNELRAEIRSLK